VALSKRLRGLLLAVYMERGRPDDDARILEGLGRDGYRRRHFKRVCDAAGLGHRRPTDLRDTFASQLLSSGVQLAYVSSQLGHADVSVTAKHYARWTGGDEYTAPRVVGPDEVPADLLSRIEGESRRPSLTPPAKAPKGSIP
jgi:integrase